MEKTIEETTKAKVNDKKVKANETENEKVFDLENAKDFEEVFDEVSKSKFFTLEEDITYKVIMVSSKVVPITSEFKNTSGESVTSMKYSMGIVAKGSDESKFEGVWEAPQSVLKLILKSFKNKKFEKGSIFNVSKTGSGLKTRYSVNKDF